jgi:hypothetical protein
MMARSPGGEAMGHGADRLGGGAGRRRRVERTEKKKQGEGGGARSPASGFFFMATRWRGVPRFGAAWRRKWGSKRGPWAQWGSTWVAGIGPRPVGAGGAGATRQGRAAGHDDTGAGS